MTGALKKAIPLLAALDMDEMTAFYRDRLGFTVRARYGDDYAILSRDEIVVNFWPCTERHIAENTSAYFNVENVDALHAEWRGISEETRMTAPTTFDYGMREFHVWDPSGNLLRFGEPV